MQFELISLFEFLSNTQAHKMVINFDRNGPLRIVDIRKMRVFRSNRGDFIQNLLVVELVIVSAFEIQHPALYFPSLAVKVDKLFNCIQHAEMLSFERSFNRHYSMAISCDLSAFLVNVFHYFADNHQRIYLGILRVYFYENETLF